MQPDRFVSSDGRPPTKKPRTVVSAPYSWTPFPDDHDDKKSKKKEKAKSTPEGSKDKPPKKPSKPQGPEGGKKS